MARAKKTKAPKATKQQLKIPGTSRKEGPGRIKELDDAAEEYRSERDKRQAQSKVEKAKKQELLAVARKHGVKVYVYEDDNGEDLEVEYTAETKENVSVKKVAPAPDGDE